MIRWDITKFCHILKDDNYPKNLEQTNPILIFDLFSSIFRKQTMLTGRAVNCTLPLEPI